ncbi:spore protease [Lachnospiraceae bacterium XBB1006]|nr:spore protease [Lachnospiraceae bacterium XBB1006]
MYDHYLHTDLALEAKEALTHTPEHASGIKVWEQHYPTPPLTITHVEILTKNAAQKIGKPRGTYLTLESPALASSDKKERQALSGFLARSLTDMLPIRENPKAPPTILVVGLGNRTVTPDSLGPLVVDQLSISRHLYREYGQSVFQTPIPYLLSAVVPGVMAQTGMETLEIIKGIVAVTKPDLCLVIDALASRSIKRLNRTIQLSDTGIHPGSGVGNHRHGITKETLGIPVLSLGVPTVVDAATIVTDSLAGDSLCSHRLSPALKSMFVAAKDTDETILRLSTLLSDAINLVFSPKPE